jgi:CubicO group peptidase (beta-lactamase class C family)
MARSLPRSTPADQQVDPAAILRFLDAVDDHPGVEMHSLMVVRHGHVVAEGWWAPYSAERPHLLYSLSKSFTSTAAAFAAAEGLLDLDDTVVSHFSEFDADITDPRSRSIRVRHVAAMASGHTREMLGEAVERDRAEPVRGFLLIPPDREPGTVFAYSQPCTYTLASIIQRNAGMPLTQYLRPRLFDPLGIGPVSWSTFPPGREQGFSGLFARTEDVAKLGQLYLQRGQWDGAQLIPADWVAQATSVQVANPEGPTPDWRQGYGFQFWMAQHGYRGDGAFGQFCVILPEDDTVIVTTASTLDMQAVLDAMWTHLRPGLGAAGPDAGAGADAAQEQLRTRLGALALPPGPAGPAGPPPADWGARAGEPFLVAGADGPAAPGPGLPQSPAPPLTAVGATPAGDGWQLTLTEDANALTFPMGNGTWAVSAPVDSRGDTIPVAASGGWLDDDTLRAEVIFLETPHRMDITCSRRDGTARAAWRRGPLGNGRLRDLHRPA